MLNDVIIKNHHVQEGRIAITAIVVKAGLDLALTVVGGDTPHIGSVVLSVPRPSLDDATLISATSSVMNVVSHKDEHALRYISEKIASKLNCHVTVSGGIHLDDITPDEIKTIMRLVQNLTQKIIEEIY